MTEHRACVLVVAAKTQNRKLVSRFLREHDCRPVAATSLSDVDEILSGGPELALAIVDSDGLGSGIWNRCEQFRAADVPFLLAALDTASVEQKGVEYGARSILAKPLAKRELAQWLRTLVASS